MILTYGKYKEKIYYGEPTSFGIIFWFEDEKPVKAWFY
tara:strand:- start:1683 stop:1796 length:114 start_codon:yes stop_codon:yes gene_type:complete